MSLVGNLVCNLPNYRLYTINKLPALKVLDFQMVTRQERDMAAKLFDKSSDAEMMALGAVSQQVTAKSAAVQEEPFAAAATQ